MAVTQIHTELGNKLAMVLFSLQLMLCQAGDLIIILSAENPSCLQATTAVAAAWVDALHTFPQPPPRHITGVPSC